MELMATCLDKLSKRVKGGFPEDILGKMAVSIIKALDYLKDTQVNFACHKFVSGNKFFASSEFSMTHEPNSTLLLPEIGV